MEFPKGRCQPTDSNELCSDCGQGWISSEFTGIPEPMPNYSALSEFHYKNVFETDHNTAECVPRKSDDFLPRPNIVEHFEKGLLTVDNEEEIEKFSNTFIVEKEYIKEYLQHIITLKRSKEIRENERSINKKEIDRKAL